MGRRAIGDHATTWGTIRAKEDGDGQGCCGRSVKGSVTMCVCVCVRIIHCRPPKPPGCAISGWELHAAPTIPTLRIAETSEMNMGN